VSRRTGHTRLVKVAIGLIAVLVGTGACGDGGDDLPAAPDTPADTPATSPPTATLDARDAGAWQEIQARFDAFMETWIKWSAEGSPGGFVDPATAELHEYADIFLWDEVVAQLDREASDGQLRTGRPEWRDSRLIEIDWDHEIQDRLVPEAIFEVCVDDSNWTLVDAETGEPVAGDRGGPHLWWVTASWVEDQESGPDGWGLTQREVDRSRSC
jgi:hypothetical protein